MKSLHVGSRHKIQTLKEAPAKGLQPQSTKGWIDTEEAFGNRRYRKKTGSRKGEWQAEESYRPNKTQGR